MIDLPGSGVTYYYRRNQAPKSRGDLLISPVGYIGAAFIGSGLVLSGFSIFAVCTSSKQPLVLVLDTDGIPLQSKIASFVIAAILLLSLIWVVKDGVAVPAILFSIISRSSQLKENGV